MARSGSGASPCDLDREFAPQIAQLLATPPPHSAQEYYEELIQSKKHDGIRVNYKGDHGKGVCANKDFAEGDLILKAGPVLRGGSRGSRPGPPKSKGPPPGVYVGYGFALQKRAICRENAAYRLMDSLL